MFTKGFEKVAKEKDESRSSSAALTGGLGNAAGVAIHSAVTAPHGEKLKRAVGVGGASMGGAAVGRALGSLAGTALAAKLKKDPLHGHILGRAVGTIAGGATGAGLAHKYMKRHYEERKD